MSIKAVLVHTCFFACRPMGLGVGSWASKKIFHENPNRLCSCSSKISFKERDSRLDNGEVLVIVYPNSQGSTFVPEWREVVAIGKQTRPPCADYIDDHDIESAYVDGSAYQRERIEAYGELALDAGMASWRPDVLYKVLRAQQQTVSL